MPTRKSKIIAGIPAYNAEGTIAKVILLTRQYVDRVIVCDQGSSDMTSDISKALGAEVIKHNENLGYGAALTTLFEKAREEGSIAMITLDGDGKHNPKDIPVLLEPIIEGEADIVVGLGLLDFAHKNKAPISDVESTFKAYNKKVIELIKLSEIVMDANIEILAKAKEAGLKVKEIPTVIPHKEDVPKGSTHNPIRRGVDMILSRVKYLSVKFPLLFYGLPGLLSLIVSAVFWSWTLDSYMRTGAIMTNVVLIAVATVIVGLMLMITGIMLWIMFDADGKKKSKLDLNSNKILGGEDIF